MSAEHCVFCDIVAGRAACAVVAESRGSLAFCDLRQPHAEECGGHVLVVSRRHCETIDALDDDSAADLFRLAVRVAAAMRAEYGDSLSLWQSNGEHAFQEVPHVHLHLITRLPADGLLGIYPGDGHPPPPADHKRLDKLAARLRRRLRS